MVPQSSFDESFRNGFQEVAILSSKLEEGLQSKATMVVVQTCAVLAQDTKKLLGVLSWDVIVCLR